MIKISGKVDKPNIYNGFFNISFFIGNRTSEIPIKNEILKNPLSVFGLFPFSLIFIT